MLGYVALIIVGTAISNNAVVTLAIIGLVFKVIYSVVEVVKKINE